MRTGPSAASSSTTRTWSAARSWSRTSRCCPATPSWCAERSKARFLAIHPVVRLVVLVSASCLVGPYVVFAQGDLDPAPRGGVFGAAPASPRGQLDLIAAFAE